MIWVRGDVRVVHEVVEKLSDYVNMLKNTVEITAKARCNPSVDAQTPTKVVAASASKACRTI
jgi:hypothetical protein